LIGAKMRRRRLSGSDHAFAPPFTVSVEPVMYFALGLARNATASAISWVASLFALLSRRQPPSAISRLLVGDRHTRAFSGQRVRDRCADSPISAGHQRPLSRQRHRSLHFVMIDTELLNELILFVKEIMCRSSQKEA
jgi:hypothetical protein